MDGWVLPLQTRFSIEKGDRCVMSYKFAVSWASHFITPVVCNCRTVILLCNQTYVTRGFFFSRVLCLMKIRDSYWRSYFAWITTTSVQSSQKELIFKIIIQTLSKEHRIKSLVKTLNRNKSAREVYCIATHLHFHINSNLQFIIILLHVAQLTITPTTTT